MFPAIAGAVAGVLGVLAPDDLEGKVAAITVFNLVDDAHRSLAKAALDLERPDEP